MSFVPYMCPFATTAPAHPAPLEESATLAAVEGPDVRALPLHLPPALLTDGRMSGAQLHAVALAVRSTVHDPPLRLGSEEPRRPGFLLGDGTGVGKSRVLAAYLRSLVGHYGAGRVRAVWCSLNQSLRAAAAAEWETVVDPADEEGRALPYAAQVDPATTAHAWTFTTYATLGRQHAPTYDRIRAWLAADPRAVPVLLLDECHRAKRMRGAASLTAQRVAELQDQFPRAHVVYSSATAASSVGHLVYLRRLGLYGEGTPFATGTAFAEALTAAGIGAMELLAGDLKRMGRLVARSISFRDATFKVRRVRLGAAAVDVYDRCARHWTTTNAATRAAGGDSEPGLWMQHQRFFRGLLTALKVPECVRLAREAVERGRAVVISLRGVGGDGRAHTTSLVEQLRALRRGPGSRSDEEEEAAMAAATEKLARRLPGNPLDELLDAFGDRADEITGRRHREVVVAAPSSDDGRKRQRRVVRRTNREVRDAFQRGDLDVVIISEAGSSGISLHAEPEDSRQRLHLILEVPWSSESFLQQCGRTHRTNQSSAPEFVLLTTDLPGESRFVAAIQRKLLHLGALTRGDRNASHAPAVEALADHDFMHAQGQRVLRTLMVDVVVDAAMRVVPADRWEEVDRRIALLTGSSVNPRFRRVARTLLTPVGTARRRRGAGHASMLQDLRRTLAARVADPLQRVIQRPDATIADPTAAEDALVAVAAAQRAPGSSNSMRAGDFFSVILPVDDGAAAEADRRGLVYAILASSASAPSPQLLVLRCAEAAVHPIDFATSAEARGWLLRHDAVRVGPVYALCAWAPRLALRLFLRAFETLASRGASSSSSSSLLHSRSGGQLWSPATHRTFAPAARRGMHAAHLCLNRRSGLPFDVVRLVLEWASNWFDMPDTVAVVRAFATVDVPPSELCTLPMSRFLNRLLGLPVRDQRHVFAPFRERLAAHHQECAAGPGAAPPPQVWRSDPDQSIFRITHRQTLLRAAAGSDVLFPVELATVHVCRARHRLAWDELRDRVNGWVRGGAHTVQAMVHRTSRRPRVLATNRDTGLVCEWRPKSARRPHQSGVVAATLKGYEDLLPADVDDQAFAEAWRLEYEALCLKDAQRAGSHRYILCGPVGTTWDLVRRVHEREAVTKTDDTGAANASANAVIRVVRCTDAEGQRLVGLQVEAAQIDMLYDLLQ